ncbi:unnamed protein product [Microthlaspi erraticum]|uniref:RNase H type-1 domain-containing protein n=1 Tax=Microthlaspi erraticum TaxID=1685480 RepID=A0A6D2JJK9_9BRAS|nr:unnamed protein product [Microthlaspi erraticum]
MSGGWSLEIDRTLGWSGMVYYAHEYHHKLMRACNLRRGLLPLQIELEALIWAMQCMLRHNNLTIVFETDCSDVVKMVSKPEEWPAFSILLEEFGRCKMMFTLFSIVYIPRTKNTKTDKLARSAPTLPTDVYYVNSVSPAWIPELL